MKRTPFENACLIMVMIFVVIAVALLTGVIEP
jgi:hypothetical protein